jgi:MFS family permease
LTVTGVATGMGYPLAGVAIQTALPPRHSAEGTSVLLTVLTAIGGIGVVAATGIIEAVGDQRVTSHGIAIVLFLLAGILLVAGAATLMVESRYARRSDRPAATPGAARR